MRSVLPSPRFQVGDRVILRGGPKISGPDGQELYVLEPGRTAIVRYRFGHRSRVNGELEHIYDVRPDDGRPPLGWAAPESRLDRARLSVV